ncbi:T9SS type A sorting domain-containing protein, partial [bacterium]|nr:T9SS type A sorting domain-containing protein [bacterium]
GDFLLQSDSAGSVTIDKCIIDPMGQVSMITMTGGFNDLWFTNNIAARHGHEIGANDGHCFIIASGAAPGGADTVWIENNTFVSIGMNWLSGSFADQINNFIFINHNTLIHSKSQMDWSILENEYYLTNNLFFDFMTSGYSYAWQPMPGGDVAMPKPMLIYSDTIPDEVLPSTRISYIQYNHLFRHQSFYDLTAEINGLDDDDTIVQVNLHPFIWDGLTPAYFGAHPDTAFAASREGHLYNHANNTNADFPMWKYGNYMYDHDPIFTDQTIYELSDSLAAWQRPATYIHALGFPSTDFPEPSTWDKWHWDPDGDPAINDTWPLFDGTYTDATTMAYSVENLPLGDLNWWPTEMALWEANKDNIYAHMKAGNTDRINITSVQDVRESGSSFSKVYPNPFSTSATIEFSLERSANVDISIYNPIGQRVKSVMSEYRVAGTHTIKFDRGDLQHGVYFYTIRAGDKTESHKIIIAQ